MGSSKKNTVVIDTCL